MILGRSTAAFMTLLVISRIGISSGLVVIVVLAFLVAVLMAALKHFPARTVPVV